MSEELTTLIDGVTILSTATSQGFNLRVYNKEKEISSKKFSWEEYGSFLKQSWENYLTKGKKPELAGYTLTDSGLVEETLHFISPNSFTSPSNDNKLPPNRELFLYWLKTQCPLIAIIIEQKEYEYLDSKLDYILKIHLERKEKKENKH